MGRYEPLTRFLESCGDSETALTFRDVETILGRPLPPSARLHQAWWSNTETHSHAESWLRAGWRTKGLDLAAERIVFQRNDPSTAAPFAQSAPGQNDSIILSRQALSAGALSFAERYAERRKCSLPQAIGDLLAQAALESKIRLLERFPLTGERSTIDSVDLVREDRDAR